MIKLCHSIKILENKETLANLISVYGNDAEVNHMIVRLCFAISLFCIFPSFTYAGICSTCGSEVSGGDVPYCGNCLPYRSSDICGPSLMNYLFSADSPLHADGPEGVSIKKNVKETIKGVVDRVHSSPSLTEPEKEYLLKDLYEVGMPNHDQ